MGRRRERCLAQLPITTIPQAGQPQGHIAKAALRKSSPLIHTRVDGNEAGLTGEFQAASDGQARVEVALELPAADAALQVAEAVPHAEVPIADVASAVSPDVGPSSVELAAREAPIVIASVVPPAQPPICNVVSLPRKLPV